MARNKMEVEFSEKLNQREIKPSENAWDRLDAMLAVAESEKRVRKFNWLYFAACFLGILLVSTLFYNRGAESAAETIIVQQEKPATTVDSTAPFESPKAEIAGANDVTTSKTPSVSRGTAVKQIAQTNLNTDKPEIQNSIINQNNQINQFNQMGNPSADELLAIAQSNSAGNDVKKSVKVSASGLLSEVDGSQNMTFRQKVLHKMGKNYQNVKVALSNRNIEEENH